MSYGIFSEIYLAIDNNNGIKIGETTNTNRRQKQLDKEGYKIIKAQYVPFEKVGRLFIESYLRLFLHSLDCIVPYRGLDYFIASSRENVDFIIENFDKIVNKATNILNDVFLSEEEREMNNFLAKIPSKYQHTFSSLLSCLKEDNYYKLYGQYNRREIKEIISILDNMIKPLGYNYKVEENWSWTYFIVSKECGLPQKRGNTNGTNANGTNLQ